MARCCGVFIITSSIRQNVRRIVTRDAACIHMIILQRRDSCNQFPERTDRRSYVCWYQYVTYHLDAEGVGEGGERIGVAAAGGAEVVELCGEADEGGGEGGDPGVGVGVDGGVIVFLRPIARIAAAAFSWAPIMNSFHRSRSGSRFCVCCFSDAVFQLFSSAPTNSFHLRLSSSGDEGGGTALVVSRFKAAAADLTVLASEAEVGAIAAFSFGGT